MASANGHYPLAYTRLVERLNRFPQGAPPTDSLYQILKILFSEREAELVAQLPIKAFTAQDAAHIWKMDVSAARSILDGLASRAILVDVEHDDGRLMYTLPPPMAGFFEFSMMRSRDDVDQKRLAELYYQYCTVEDEFFGDMFTAGRTHMGRVFVNEPVIPSGVEVLDYERATHVITSAAHMGISQCYCRYKKQLAEVHPCDAPMDICMTFNITAQSLIKHGFARQVDQAEGLDLLQMAYENNLVQFGDNSRELSNFICNCCGCCCEALIAARRFETLNPLHSSNFMPVVDDDCSGCGKCVNICPVEAMTLVSAHDPAHPNKKKARLNEDICLGCGVCARVCATKGITMTVRAQRVFTPLTFAHRVVLSATERGQLQDLVFDRQTLRSQRALAAVLGAILRLPPIKRTLAQQQMKSRFLEAWISRVAND